MKNEWDMTDEQVEALQCLANLIWSMGGRWNLEKTHEGVRNHSGVRTLNDCYPDDDKLRARLTELYKELEEFGYVKIEEWKGKTLIQLTKEGYRCPRITVI